MVACREMGGFVLSLCHSMILEPTERFDGKVGRAFDEVWRALRSLRPAISPGVLTSLTHRGVHRTRLDDGSNANSPVQLQLVAEYDDFLECLDDSGQIVYVAKPQTLRASQWKPGWQAGNPKPGATYYYGDPASPSQSVTFSLMYIERNIRKRLVVPPFGVFAKNILHSQFGGNVEKDFDFLVVTEVINPPYAPALVNNTQGYVKDQMFRSIIAQKFDTAFFTTPEILGTVGETLVPAGQPVQYLDLNNDARRWDAINLVTVNLIYMEGDDPQGSWALNGGFQAPNDQKFT